MTSRREKKVKRTFNLPDDVHKFGWKLIQKTKKFTETLKTEAKQQIKLLWWRG